MSDLTIQLLRLINEGKTLNEISEILNISHKKIFNYLTMIKNTGYDFKRNYYFYLRIHIIIVYQKEYMLFLIAVI